MPFFTLQEFIKQADDATDAGLKLRTGGPALPTTLATFNKLDRLDLLTDEVVLALIGQANLDPLGLYGAMKSMGVWAFNAIDFTMVQVLAKVKDVPVAIMRLDLFTDDLVFVVLKEGQLVEHEKLAVEDLVAQLKEPGMTETGFKAWLTDHMRAAIKAGRGDKD